MEILILSIVAEYGYDASRRRIIKKRYTGGTLVVTEHVYLSANWQTLEVRLDSEVPADQQYIWGLRYIDDLVVRDRTVSNPLDERIYAMHESQWNVIALADASGDVVERFAYQPYGESQVHSSTFTSSSDSYHWQYSFTGREHDPDTGLDYFRNRYWHNLVGAFITRDPLEYVDRASMYAGWYIPYNMDPFGNDKITCRYSCSPNHNGTQVKSFEADCTNKYIIQCCNEELSKMMKSNNNRSPRAQCYILNKGGYDDEFPRAHQVVTCTNMDCSQNLWFRNLRGISCDYEVMANDCSVADDKCLKNKCACGDLYRGVGKKWQGGKLLKYGCSFSRCIKGCLAGAGIMTAPCGFLPPPYKYGCIAVVGTGASMANQQCIIGCKEYCLEP